MVQIWSYCMLGVKWGAICKLFHSSRPSVHPRNEPWNYSILKKKQGEKRIMVEAFKINIKPRTPGAFPMMHCSLLPTVTWDIVSEAGGWGLPLTNYQCHGYTQKMGLGETRGHPQCRLIEDNNTATVIRTQARELPAKSARMTFVW